MQTVDPRRLDLAAEYKSNPFGPYGAELQKLLMLLHWDHAEDRFIAVQMESGGPWSLARTRGGRGVPMELYLSHQFTDAAEVRWAIFRKRWQQRTGELPVVDPGDEIDPASGKATMSDAITQDILTGYTDRFSVHTGDTIEFYLSTALEREFDAEIVRLRCGDEDNIGFRQTAVESSVTGTYAGRKQPVHAGSYVEVPGALPESSLFVHALIWPTLPGQGQQTIFSSWDDSQQSGLALVLDAHGALSVTLGDGHRQQLLSTDAPLHERCWYRVACCVDLQHSTVWLRQHALAGYPGDPSSTGRSAQLELTPVSNAPVRIGACATSASQRHDGAMAASAHFNGKIEAPACYAEPVTSDAGTAFLRTGCWPERMMPSEPFGIWDFSRQISSEEIVDCSSAARHGRTWNMPTRAMKGAAWDGTEYNWTHKPEHYAAIHFHDDDLHDCGWEADFSFRIPDDLKSGLYAAHLTQNGREDWLPFVVSPPPGTARARLALILPSASYWAYANRSSITDYAGREHVRNTFSTADPTSFYLHHHPELGLSMYDNHRDGSGVCISSRLRPVLSLRPNDPLWQLPADTHLIDWLEARGIDYDVLSEDDLDRYGAQLLEPYQCVMTGTHPEYPSLAMMDAYRDYQEAGGRFMYMGGNGFYWRVSYHPQIAGVMEMRRAEDGIRAWLAEGGEYYHAFTGELGGMWRRMGRAPQSVAGTGMTAQGFDRSTFYRLTPDACNPRAAFIFENVGADEKIGDFGIVGGGAAGWEIDRADPALGTPPHALVIAQATDFTSAYHWMKEELTHTHSAVTGDTCPHVHCDMVFYETANGGAVFSTSSIAWAGALAHNNYDNNVSTITGNVLERFLDPEPFDVAGAHASSK